MSHIRLPRCDNSHLEEATQNIFNGELLLDAEKENLYIKNKNRLILIGGAGKQNLFKEGDNIEILPDDLEDINAAQTIRLKDDIDINTCTLSPSEDILDWKGCVKLGEIENYNQLFILTKYTPADTSALEKAILGGEVIVKLIRDDDTFEYAHSAISVSSTGSWSLKGSSNTENNLRMCEFTKKDTKDTYYGLKIPNGIGIEFQDQLEYYDEEEEYIEKEKYTVEESIETIQEDDFYIGRLNSSQSFRTNTAYNNLAIYCPKTGVTCKLISTGVASGNAYNHWVYCSFREFVNLRSGTYSTGLADSELKKMYDDDYYIYFLVYTKDNTSTVLTFRITQVVITKTGGEKSPWSDESDIYASYGTANQEWMAWDGSLVTTRGYKDLGPTNNYQDKLGTFMPLVKYTELVEKERDVVKIRTVTKSRVIQVAVPGSPIKFKKAEFWFNGWARIPETLQISDYADSDFDYVVLSDVSNDNDSFAETFYGSADEAIRKLRELPNTGEDNAPYKLIFTGSLSMSDLETIAALCRNSQRQVYLDMSQATVDNTAKVWDRLIFNGCSSLRGVKIPKGIVSIEQCVFVWCTFLRELDLTPSELTLTDMGFKSNYSENIGMFTSTRIKNLIIPSKVAHLWQYIVSSSNLRNLVFLHTGDNPMDVVQWTFMMNSVIKKQDTTLPTDFHLFVSTSWYNNYLKNAYWNYNGYTIYSWNNPSGWWTTEVINAMVIFDPGWSQENWQSFNDIYQWGEEFINDVRSHFGYPSRIEIKEK